MTNRAVVVHFYRQEGVEEVPLACDIPELGRVRSIQEIFAEAGITIRHIRQFKALPAEPGRVSESLLDQWLRELPRPRVGNARLVRGLVVKESLEYPQRFGALLDQSRRSDFVVFTRAGSERWAFMRSVVHELAHVFNLHHEDWEEEGLWHFGEDCMQHLQEHPPELVWPGRGAKPFMHVTRSHLSSRSHRNSRRRSSPNENVFVVHE